MKKIISIFLMLIVVFATFAPMAIAAGSPTAEMAFLPRTNTSVFRVCDIDGKTVRYLTADEIKVTAAPPTKDNYVKNLLYSFEFESSYELKDGEYIEYPFQFRCINSTLVATINGNSAILEFFDPDYWTLHITEYGLVQVVVVTHD